METGRTLFLPIILAILLIIILCGIIFSFSFLGNLNLWRFVEINSLILTVIFSFSITWAIFPLKFQLSSLTNFFKIKKQNNLYLTDYFLLCLTRNLLLAGTLGSLIGTFKVLGINMMNLSIKLSISMITFLYAIIITLLFPLPYLIFIRIKNDYKSNISFDDNLNHKFYRLIAMLVSAIIIFLQIHFFIGFSTLFDFKSIALFSGFVISFLFFYNQRPNLGILVLCFTCVPLSAHLR